MATGDNVLTAISVARQCKILSQESEVYLGDLVKDQDGFERVEWTSSQPVDREFEGPDKKDTLINATVDFKPNKGAASFNGLPWNFKNTGVDVALTGKAFKYLENNKLNDMFTFKSVLARAQVFARMSPDDKALLVSSLQDHFLD